jgi:hypothetical protein
MYSYMVVVTEDGKEVRTEKAPSELFTDHNCKAFLQTIDGVKRWELREVVQRTDGNVIYADF